MCEREEWWKMKRWPPGFLENSHRSSEAILHRLFPLLHFDCRLIPIGTFKGGSSQELTEIKRSETIPGWLFSRNSFDFNTIIVFAFFLHSFILFDIELLGFLVSKPLYVSMFNSVDRMCMRDRSTRTKSGTISVRNPPFPYKCKFFASIAKYRRKLRRATRISFPNRIPGLDL